MFLVTVKYMQQVKSNEWNKMKLKIFIMTTIILVCGFNAKASNRKPNEVQESSVKIWCAQNYLGPQKRFFSKDFVKKNNIFRAQTAFNEKWEVHLEYANGLLTYRTKIDGEGKVITVSGDIVKSALTISSENEFGLSCSLDKKFITE